MDERNDNDSLSHVQLSTAAVHIIILACGCLSISLVHSSGQSPPSLRSPAARDSWNAKPHKIPREGIADPPTLSAFKNGPIALDFFLFTVYHRSACHTPQHRSSRKLRASSSWGLPGSEKVPRANACSPGSPNWLPLAREICCARMCDERHHSVSCEWTPVYDLSL